MDVTDFKEKHKDAIENISDLLGLFSGLGDALKTGLESLENLESIGEQTEKLKKNIKRLKTQNESSEEEANRIRIVIEKERKKLSDYKAERSGRLSKMADEFNKEQKELMEKEIQERKLHFERLADLKTKEKVIEIEIENRKDALDVLEKKISGLQESIKSLSEIV